MGASADQVSWIQTAYLIPEVVMIPLSGYLSRLWGTQRVYLISCTGFIVMSVLTGLSSSIDMMIITRALQGFIGGAMIPTVFAVAFTAFPPERRVTASVIMGLIVTLAPTVGPTLGGHLTEWLSWRWLFFINVPTGLVVLFGVARWGQFDKGDPSLAKGFDWFGLAVMAIFLMSMQFVLEEGSKDGWFEDSGILGLTVVGHGDRYGLHLALAELPQPDRRAEGLRQPQFQHRRDDDGRVGGQPVRRLSSCCRSSWDGCGTIRPRGRHHHGGLGPVDVRHRADRRPLGPPDGPPVPMFIGFMLAGFGMYMAHGVTKDWGFWEFAGVQACRGVGVMIAMIATQQVTMSTLPPHMVKNASGLVNLSRNTGGAIGLALLATTITNQTALYYMGLSDQMGQGDARLAGMMQGLAARMQQLGVADPDGAARKAISGMLSQQATVLAFGDSFTLLAYGCFLAAVVCAAGQAGQERPLLRLRTRTRCLEFAGQIDVAKTEAILDAAVEVIGQRGLGAPMEAIAKRAGVSKQTVYNHYGSKADLMRALMQRRVESITAPLRDPGAVDNPTETLEAYALSLLDTVITNKSYSMMRVVMLGAGEMPDVAQEVYEAGPLSARRQLAAFLKAETELGRMKVDDFEQGRGAVLRHGHGPEPDALAPAPAVRQDAGGVPPPWRGRPPSGSCGPTPPIEKGPRSRSEGLHHFRKRRL